MGSAGRAGGRRFDREHGVTTQAIFFLSQLGSIENEAYAHATHYEPVPVEAFRALIACLSEAVVRRSTFVDAGSGMGRALLLASEYPFKQVLGIELSPVLHAIANANLSTARGLAVRCRDMRLRCVDARRARYPKGDLVVFLFNPFDETVLRAVLDRIVGSRRPGERVVVIYHVPVHSDVLLDYSSTPIAQTSDGTIAALTRCPERPDLSASTRSAKSRSLQNR
jgi:SAM-dependent methyltransferase